ncbi:exonuclease SbcCD subunit D [Cocleimonas sp. KMM 6892]|uniref:exonuclease SbcCD subunit D n=1 Tax=unclassified Cocleimonas TaxID=2639732 RepID=UPI002DB8D474|nr:MULTISPECIES: exonuclease SbcCD subunit D [unclassified Cocleimonas]MEB8433874.1 exonuclease SbcCD subunit D [Cocleimonas sp. KMM 6892]MEC4716685.1 exonuclease SbcCD subunit D [Cocleimonas sp. KMM 6895]MEC4746160.1 exonuclease SbcCD subunit D [Cocleimonas sp. KMM 6896]
MRILHTSDWHIGRQFHNVSLVDDQAYVLDQIIDIAKTEAVDVVIIAGDIYDRAIPPASAVSLVDKTLNHLCNVLNIPVIMIAGNHDSPERLSFGSRQLSQANLYITGPSSKKVETVVLNDAFGEVTFYSIPYADPATVRSVFAEDDGDDSANVTANTDSAELRTHDQCMARIIKEIPDHKKQRSVAISHCFLAGGDGCESERPLSVGGAEHVTTKHFKNFNYTALGHLHSQQHRTEKNIRYSGSILKYSFSEEHHNKSITLVDMDEKGECEIKQIALKALHDMRSISGAFDEIIEAAKKDKHPEDYLLISLTDKHAILDPMGKLRQVYPNVLHLERPGLMSSGEQKLAHRDLLKKGELSMFKDFYNQVQDQALDKDQEKVLETILDEIHSNNEAD